MAKPQNEDLSKCLVCFEKCEEFRKLPTCGHSFCEKCIYKYVSISKTESESTFTCPVCRAANPYPRDEEDFVDWIKTLEIKVTYESLVNMDDCGPCGKLKKSSKASKYCIGCLEKFCVNCFDLCHSLELLNDHSFVEIKPGDNNGDEMLRKLAEYLKCPEHPGKIVAWICEDENKLCCQTCAFANHRKCTKVTELENRLSREDADKEANSLDKLMKEMIAYGQVIIEAIKGHEKGYKTKAENISQKIRDIRAKVNQMFDVLEGKIAETCRTLSKKHSLVDESKVHSVKEIVDKLTVACSLLEIAKQSSTLKAVVLPRLKENFDMHETAVLEIIPDLRRPGFELQTKSLLNNIVELSANRTENLAVVKENESNVCLPEYKRRQLLKYSTITEIGTYSIRIGDIGLPYYCNVIYLPNGNLIFVEATNGICCLVDSTFKLVASCHFTTYKTKEKDPSKIPYSASYLRDDIVIVSVPAEKEIFFLDVREQLTIVGTANTIHTPQVLHALTNGDIAVSWSHPVAFGISSLLHCVLKEKVYFTHDKAGRVLKSFDYMAIDEKRSHVIQPCQRNKAVYCFDLEGNPKFAYTHEKLKNPLGVDLDGDGNIYVCDRSMNCIHILSAGGVPIKLFLDGCPYEPLAVRFDKNRTSFIVSHSRPPVLFLKKLKDACEIDLFRLR